MDRILIKISGESIADENAIANAAKVKDLVKQIETISAKYSVAIVIGGGNIWRGAKNSGLDIPRPISDTVGMVATTINATILAESINSYSKCKAKVFAAGECYNLTNKINHNEINEWLSKKGNVIVFAGGTGNPYFTTDSGAALRAAEIKAKWIVMGKNGVDGIYSADPKKDKNAKLYSKLSYKEIIDKKLSVMDLTALTLCSENGIKIKVFNANKKNGYVDAINDKIKSTIVE